MTCGQSVDSAISNPTRTDAATAPVAATNFDFNAPAEANPFESSAPRQPRKPLGKPVIIAAGAVAALLIGGIAFAAIDNARYLKPDANPTLIDNISAAKISSLAAEKCDALAGALPSEAQVALVLARTGSINKYVGGNARKAKKFMDNALWIDTTPIVDVDSALNGAIAGSLDDSISKMGNIRESDRATFASKWENAFLSIALADCGLLSRVDSVKSTQVDFASAKDSLSTLAASVPWYPDGFNEWTDDTNVAWKWVNGLNCNLGDWCWHIKVVTRTGCPNGLYAELNELDAADNVIDYTNDTVPSLGAGDTAVLEFSTYNSSASSGRIATITCHNF